MHCLNEEMLFSTDSLWNMGLVWDMDRKIDIMWMDKWKDNYLY